MQEELRKSLTDLIDETLLELEELKKSRFAAAVIKIEGPGEGIAGKPSDGELDAQKADEEAEEEDEEEKEEAEKAEGKNEEAAKAEGMNEEPKRAKESSTVAKAEEKKEEKEEGEEEEKEEKAEKKLMKKSVEEATPEEVSPLMKSFVEERVKPLEDKLSTILDLVNKIAEQPMPPKGVPANAVPLKKSADEAFETLSKSEIASKLFELKKSGTKVDTLDITRAEMGQDLQKIVEKYKIS
jgi:hypothetical protein